VADDIVLLVVMPEDEELGTELAATRLDRRTELVLGGVEIAFWKRRLPEHGAGL
jgi:hypothetical protein